MPSFLNQHAFFKQQPPKRNWSYVMPTVVLMSVGSVMIPHFSLGLALGVANLVLASMVGLLVSLLPIKKANQEDYRQQLLSYPMMVTVFAPTLEELLFRGLLQTLLIALFPQASLMAVCITALLFGLAHLTNAKENDAYHQAINTTFSGIFFGLVAMQLGLWAAIAAHMMNNTIALTLLMLCGVPAPKPQSTFVGQSSLSITMNEMESHHDATRCCPA